MASAEGKRTERFSEKSLNLENSLNLRFGFPRVKRHFSYESNEQFQEWTPDVDTSRPPVGMMINSSELRSAGFKLKEVLPPALEAVVRGGMPTRGAGLRSLEGMGPKRFVLSVDDDTEFRSRCE